MEVFYAADFLWKTKTLFLRETKLSINPRGENGEMPGRCEITINVVLRQDADASNFAAKF
jgi:hypothetical protein